jgi:hypothetical protein
MFWGQSTRERLSRLIKKFFGKYSLLEIYQQVKAGRGEAGEYFKEELESFSKKTAHEEIAHAITLADFYFLDSKPVICFEMKRGFIKKEVENLNEILENLESNTEIDCLIEDGKREFKFQLKQYPEKYKDWSPNKVIKYLNESILPKSRYNNESNSDLIVVIAIKPELHSEFKETQDFSEIHKYLSSQSIKLREINFLYNRNMEHMVWYQVYPKKGHYKIPWQNLSYHQAKRRTTFRK